MSNSQLLPLNKSQLNLHMFFIGNEVVHLPFYFVMISLILMVSQRDKQ